MPRLRLRGKIILSVKTLAIIGLGMGIATACAYVPMVAVVSGWFVRRRAAAVGVAVAGIGAGNLVMNPVSARLIDHSGWRSTYRLYALVGTALLVGCALVARRPPVGARMGSPFSHMRRAARTSTFRWLYLATLLMTLTLFTPFVHLTNYAKERGIASGRAALLVGLIGAASIGGRVVFGMLGGRFGVLRLYQGSFLVMALSSSWFGGGLSPEAIERLASIAAIREVPPDTELFHEGQVTESMSIVLAHHPPFTAVERRQGDNPQMTALTPMFEKYHVTAGLFGHDHNYQHYLKNGVHYFTTGGGGAPSSR